MKLYGFAVSNYFKMVHMALLEKGAEFSIETVYPSQEAAYLAKNPVGKVPCLETEHGFLAETAVILDYIEEQIPAPALYPVDPFQRARVRQVMHMLELYIELPARRLFPGVFFGGDNADHTIAEVRPVLEKGIKGIASLVNCNPFLMGASLSYADIFALYTFSLASAVCNKVYGWDIVAEVDGLAGLLGRLGEREAARTVSADDVAAMAAFQQRLAGR